MSQAGMPEVSKAKTKKSEALWMMTFADMSFILMCFFALQISFSKANKQQFDNVVSGLAQEPKYQTKPEDNLKELEQKIQSEIKKKKLEHSAHVKLDADGLAIEFRDNLLFKAGSADASAKMLETSKEIMGIIGKASHKYQITIEGHTDDTALVGHRLYKSNWELSAARGITLLNNFAKHGVEKSKMRVLAYADTRPKVDISSLRGEKLRAARSINRRVVIRVE